MSIWTEFEIQATEYLENKYGKVAKFIHEGVSDSTVPDIKVINMQGETYYIEAKKCPAQSGQFVLMPNMKNNEFEYSKKNVDELDESAKTIIERMNLEFNEFNSSGTAGKDIDFPNCQKVFSNWIKRHYKEKGVKFVITNDYNVLSIDDFENAFIITAKYRVKRSGSTKIPKKKLATVQTYLAQNYKIEKFENTNGSLFVQLDSELHGERFYIDLDEYMISKREDKYEVRKLSNTFHANVIFSIEKKPGFVYLTDEELAKKL